MGSAANDFRTSRSLLIESVNTVLLEQFDPQIYLLTQALERPEVQCRHLESLWKSAPAIPPDAPPPPFFFIDFPSPFFLLSRSPNVLLFAGSSEPVMMGSMVLLAGRSKRTVPVLCCHPN